MKRGKCAVPEEEMREEGKSIGEKKRMEKGAFQSSFLSRLQNERKEK